MRVLVTGGAGFIGSHTVDALLERGYDVRILDSLQPRVHPRGRPTYLPREADLVIGDVSEPDRLAAALEGCHGVIHLAAYQDYLPDFSRFVHTNAESTALLFELIVADRHRFPIERVVLASSQAVAGEGRYRCRADGRVFLPGPRPLAQLQRGVWDIACPDDGAPSDPLPIDETVCDPHTAYGISKYAIELLARALGPRYGIPTTALRYTYVQGPRNSFHNAYSGIARRFALRIRAGLPPLCYEDGLQRRDYVNVRDVARANVIALEHPAAEGRVLNVGGGRPVTVLEFARLMLRESGSPLEPIVPGEFRVGDTRHTVSDSGAMRALGWEPGLPVEQNVREYLAWIDAEHATSEHLVEAERVMADLGVVQRVGEQA